MPTMIQFIENKQQKEQIAKEILHNLPEWFGLPDSTAEYIRCSQDMPFWADIQGEVATGFVALKETSAHTVEIYVMGVLKAFHRKQIGKQLFDHCLQYAKERGYSFMQVKTVKEGCYKEYDSTIAFYKQIGFKEFECFPTLWDEWNPCQVLVIAI